MLIATAVLAGTAGYAEHAAAQAPASNDAAVMRELRRELQAMRARLAEQDRLLREQTRRMETQQRELAALRRTVDTRPAGLSSIAPAARPAENQRLTYAQLRSLMGGSGSGVAQAQPGQQGQTGQPGQTGTEQPQQSRPEISDPALATQGGVLTGRNTLVIEPTFEYSYQSLNRVNVDGFTIIPGITFGNIEIREVQRRVFTPSLTARYGITDRLEVNVRVPYVFRSDTTTTSPVFNQNQVQPLITSTTGSNIGDIEVGASYQINNGADGWPFFVANLRFKTITGRSPFDVPIFAASDADGQFRQGLERELPTGSGFYSIEPGVTVIFPSDPVVFFGNIRYIANLGRTVDVANPANGQRTPTKLNPGDGIGVSIGMGFAINERASFSLGYEHTFVLPASQQGQRLSGSSYDSGSFNLGFTYRVSDSVSINTAVSVGTSSTSPDVRFILRVPVRLNL